MKHLIFYNLLIFLVLTQKVFCQTTPYALDSNLLNQIDKELNGFGNYILTDISSFWKDDFKLIGIGQNLNGKTKKITIFLQKD